MLKKIKKGTINKKFKIKKDFKVDVYDINNIIIDKFDLKSLSLIFNFNVE